jgi:chromate transport protein ChrA
MIAQACLIMIATYIYNYFRGNPQVDSAFRLIQIAVFAMILAVAFETVNIAELFRWRNLFVIVAAFCLFAFAKVHPAFIIIGAGLLGAFIFK